MSTKNSLKASLVITIFLILNFCIEKKRETSTQEIPTKRIDVVKMVDLYNLSPSITLENFFSGDNTNIIGRDRKGNYYFLDRSNHRILKYSSNWEFVIQIGEFGKNNDDLYYPSGLVVDGDKIYISTRKNPSQYEIKIFSVHGKYRNSVGMPKRHIINSFAIFKDNIYVSLLSPWNEKMHLIDIIDQNGELIQSYGAVISTGLESADSLFNEITFSINTGYITGSFINWPIIFKYSLEGDEIIFKHMNDFNLKEINKKFEIINQKGHDTPDQISRDAARVGIRYTEFCSGLITDNDSHMYYAVNSTNCIYRFNEKGEPSEKYLCCEEGKSINIIHLYYDKIANRRIFIGTGIDDDGKTHYNELVAYKF